MTDNGSGLPLTRPRAAPAKRSASATLRTRPYRPRTNGKAERFIQTLSRLGLRHRSTAQAAPSAPRTPAWLDHYNFTRPHGSLSHKPTTGSRLNNVPRNYN